MFDIYDDDEVMAKIHDVEQTFHLVLVVEKFQVYISILVYLNANKCKGILDIDERSAMLGH